MKQILLLLLSTLNLEMNCADDVVSVISEKKISAVNPVRNSKR